MKNLIQDIKGKVESAYVEAPFDKAKKELESNKYRIISLSENAKLRMQEGKDAFISQNGNYTREGVIYLPSNKIYLTKSSPIMENAEEATECHRKGNEFYLNDKQVSNAIKKGTAVKFPQNDNYSIPTDKFGEDIITDFAFGKIAKDYGKFLKEEAKINEMPVWLSNCENKPFARQLWFRGLGGGVRSGLGGFGSLDYYGDGVRGVREVSAEGAAQKISLPYKQKDIKNYLNILQDVREGNLPASKLEKVIKGLEKLKQ